MRLVIPHNGGRHVIAVLRQVVIDVRELAIVPLRGVRGMGLAQLRQVGQGLGEFGLISGFANRRQQDSYSKGSDNFWRCLFEFNCGYTFHPSAHIEITVLLFDLCS